VQNKFDIKNFLLDLLFPRFCFGCHQEGSYLCEDCRAILEISQYQYCLCYKPIRVIRGGKCSTCASKKLNGIYSAVSYRNKLVQALIKNFKYEPFVKELAKPLAQLMTDHFQLLDTMPDFSGFALVAIPLEKKKMRKRGFNQAEEIAKELSLFLNLPLLKNVLIKTKETVSQTELSEFNRLENIKGVFQCPNPEIVQDKKILLIDDVYTTGATMNEAARILKEAGAKQVWGVTVARG